MNRSMKRWATDRAVLIEDGIRFGAVDNLQLVSPLQG